jgi:PilZ domain
MNELVAELERREHLRHPHSTECEVLLEGRTHGATVVNLSRGGVYLQSDAPVWPGAMVRLRLRNIERYALVLRKRHVPHQLRDHVPGGFGLRWVRSGELE